MRTASVFWPASSEKLESAQSCIVLSKTLSTIRDFYEHLWRVEYANLRPQSYLSNSSYEDRLLLDWDATLRQSSKRRGLVAVTSIKITIKKKLKVVHELSKKWPNICSVFTAKELKLSEWKPICLSWKWNIRNLKLTPRDLLLLLFFFFEEIRYSNFSDRLCLL